MVITNTSSEKAEAGAMKLKLSPRGMKALKVAHLSFVGLWLGGNVSAVLLSLLGTWTPTDATMGIYLALKFIDYWVIVPGSIGCLLTGIAYGLWTNWGFFKFRWITIKWVVMIIQMILGAGFLGRAVASNVRLLTTLGVAAVILNVKQVGLFPAFGDPGK